MEIHTKHTFKLTFAFLDLDRFDKSIHVLKKHIIILTYTPIESCCF